MENNDYVLGRLTATTQNLEAAVALLTTELRILRAEINNINLFRAKVIGLSVGASAAVSLALKAIEVWAK